MKQRDEKSSGHGADVDDDGPPPFGGSWARLYALVLCNLFVLIVLFYLFTKAFG